VVLTPRRWRQVRGGQVGPTGRGRNLNPRTTVAKEPGHRGEHEISRKTIACGNAGCFRCTRLLVCFLPMQSAHEAAGAAGTRRSPRPHKGGRSSNASGASRREGEVVSGMRGTSLALPATMSARPGRKPMAPALGPQHQRRAPHFPPDMPQFRRPGPGLSKTGHFFAANRSAHVISPPPAASRSDMMLF